MTREEFEEAVQLAFDSIPERFRDGIENVAIVVEDEATEIVNRRRGVRQGSLLLGLYEGVPLSRRGPYYGTHPVLPDRITLYRIPLERISRSPQHLQDNIRDTLIHEIGHYFGMGEDEIRDAGY